MPLTPVYGLPYEAPGDQPLHSLTGGSSGTEPILAEQVEDELVRIDANLASVVSDVSSLQSTAIRRVATATLDTDSATFTTTEVVVHQVSASLEGGRRYAIWCPNSRWASDVAGARVVAKIREDSVSGTQLTRSGLIHIVNTSDGGFPGGGLYAEFDAVATGVKVFVLTGDRDQTTSGNCRLVAVGGPVHLFVDDIGPAS